MDIIQLYIDMNTKLRKEAKNEFEKDFFRLKNNAVFGKTMENIRNYRYIKLVTTDKRRNQLVSEPNYHTSKYFSEHLVAIEMKKTKVKMNKPICLGMPILSISNTLMCEFWYVDIKAKYGDRVKLCYTDTDSFIIDMITEDFYKDIANDVEKWFDTSNYEKNDDRLLPIGKYKKLIGLFKDQLARKIMKLFVGVRPKTWTYLMDDDREHKKGKGTKKCIIRKDLMVKNYEDCLFNNKIILKSQQVFRSDHHNVYPAEINNTAVSSNMIRDSIETFDRNTTYPHGTNPFKVRESEMMIMRDIFVKNYAGCPFYDDVILQQRW